MSNLPLLVIFTGLPGTGKTSISQHVARELSMPLIAKDAIKEIMYDEIGIGDKSWSGKLARATLQIMNHVTAELLRTGTSLIIESNYRPDLANDEFTELQKQHPFRCVQVICQTDPDVLAKRVHHRSKTNRHPGHNDVASEQEHRSDAKRRIENNEDQPLDIAGSETIIVDTTDFSKVDMAAVAKRIRALR